MNRNDIFTKLQEIARQNLNLTQKDIARAFLKRANLEKFNIRNFAAQANCSQANVIKFVKQFGFSGTKTFVPYILNQLKMMQAIDFEPENKVGRNYLGLITNNLENACRYNSEAIIKTAEEIRKSQRIFLFGKGPNLMLMQMFSNYLSKQNYNTYYASDTDVQKHWFNLLTPQDLIFCFSFSGFNSDIVELLNDKQSVNWKIVAFSANFNSILSQKSTIFFRLGKNEEIFANERNSRITLIYLINEILRQVNKH